MTEELGVAAAFLGLASMICGLLGIFFTITVAFSRIREVETRIATPGTYLDMTRALWGSGPWGRWIRAMNVWSFFVYRNLPIMGDRIEARMGNEEQPTPQALKLWVLLPVSYTFLCAVIFVVSAVYLTIVE